MPIPTPTLDQAIDAVVTELVTMPGGAAGTVLHWENNKDDETETLEQYQDAASGEIFVTFVSCAGTRKETGSAWNEDYEIYPIKARLVTLMLDEEEWDRHTLTRAQLMVNELDKNTAVFRIGGQVPVNGTPETAEIESHGFVSINDQRFFQAVIAVEIEARRWS